MAPRFALTAGLVVSIFALAACAHEASSSPAAVVATTDDPYGLNGTFVDSGYEMPDVTLTDTHGRPYSLAEDATKPVTLIFFMYTHCPDVCPTTLADIAAALRRIDPDDRSKVDVIAITTDPARDTPGVMADFLAQFDPSFTGLTGDLAEIEKAAAALGIALTGQTKLPSGGYEVGHGAQIIGFAPTGAVVWSEGSPVGLLRHDLEILVDQA